MNANLEIQHGKQTARVVRKNWLWPGSIYKQLPHLGYFQYIAEYWDLAGKALNTGMGRVPLSWQELRAMEQCSHAPLSPWEAEVIIEMSRAFCGYAASTDKNEPAPYRATDDPTELAVERGRQNEHTMRGG